MSDQQQQPSLFDSEQHWHDTSGSFSHLFPLPLRILALLSLGVAAWASNLHILTLYGIDATLVLDVKTGEGVVGANSHGVLHPSRLYPPIYKLAGLLAGWTAFGWLVYSLSGYTGNQPANALTTAFLLVPLFAVFLPTDNLCRRERAMFLRSLQRTLFDGIFSPVPFSDVILADIFTSFAKVLGDVWISLAVLFVTSTRRAWGGHWGVPLLTSFPYVLRFRQCISEYLTTPDPQQPSAHLPPSASSTAPLTCNTPSNPRTRALFNALKYASAFPVIIFSALQGQKDLFQDPYEDEEHPDESLPFLFKLWAFAVLFNSLYSFWWDVTNDWGLALLIPSAWKTPPAFLSESLELIPFASGTRAAASSVRAQRMHGRARSLATANRSVDHSAFASAEPGSGRTSPPPPNTQAADSLSASQRAKIPNPTYHSAGPFLRPHILLPGTAAYYIAIAIDLLLRLTWSLKLSSHLHAIHEIESGIFLMEALEVLRRWMWTFIRIEWEAVKKSSATSAESASGISLRTRHVNHHSTDHGLLLSEQLDYKDPGGP